MSKGRFGIHGGQYIPETLMNAVIELEKAYNYYKNDKEFNDELNTLLNEYAGRPSLLYYAARMTEDLGGAKIYLKREDLNHTGAHKINNVLGQVLLAKKMGKTRVIAETGAGQHGVATATAAALMGMECEVFMGKEDTERQALNVYRMRLLGAQVHAVTSGTGTLKDAVSETMREWTRRIDDTHYVLGSCMGPHPFPQIVRDFQAVISKEIKEQILEKEGKLKAVITQNIDGLHQMAGSKNVLELHGSIHRNYCMRCGKFFDAAYVKNSEGAPKCDECGGLIKPDVVLYEEGLDENVISKTIHYISQADVLIIGGTSLVVYPAAGLIDYFKGSHLILINKSKTERDSQADLIINDKIGEVFKQL